MAYVYLLGDWDKEGTYKIGVTRGDIQKRIKKLQTGNSGEIYLVDYFETEFPFVLEKMLHVRFCGENVMNEWFTLENEDIANFKKVCKELQENIDALKDNYFFKKKYKLK